MIERLPDDRAHAHARVQRRIRILKHDLKMPARAAQARAADSARTSRSLNVISPEVGSISRRMHRPVVVLPAAGFADQPERLAGLNVKRDVVDGAHGGAAPEAAPACRELLHEVTDLKQRRHEEVRVATGAGECR